MRLLKQSTARSVAVFLADSSDHVAGATGKTLAVTASKDGAAFASVSPTVTELANGWYKLALTTAHTDTLGDLALHVTASGADPADVLCQVVADLPGVLPAVTTDWLTAAGVAAAAVTKIQSGLMTLAGYTAPDNSGIASAASSAASAASSSASAATAAGSADTKLSAGRLGKLDSLTFTMALKLDAKLTSDGLDNLSATPPTGVASTFREKVLQLWERFFGKVVKDDGAGTIKVMQGTGSTPQATQAFTSVGGVDTVNKAT